MEIRKATLSDCDAIAKLIEELAIKFIVHEFSEFGKNQFLSSNDQERIAEFMNHGFEYHVAVGKNKIVGVVGMRENSHLYHLLVSEEHQGKGLSRELWELAKNKCLSKGNPGKFTVNSSNNAVGVYEAFGFKRTSAMEESNGVLYNPMLLEINS